MKNINKTKTISEILNTFTFGDDSSKGKSFSDTIKQSTMFSFWEDIVGKKIAKFTRPTKIKYSKLYVSAKSPVIVQELDLIKKKILEKANKYSLALGFQIKDIVYDYKNYNENLSHEYPEGENVEYYSEESLAEYVIDENTKNEIEKNISKFSFLNQEQKNKLTNQIINVKKAQLKRLHGLDKKD